MSWLAKKLRIAEMDKAQKSVHIPGHLWGYLLRFMVWQLRAKLTLALKPQTLPLILEDSLKNLCHWWQVMHGRPSSINTSFSLLLTKASNANPGLPAVLLGVNSALMVWKIATHKPFLEQLQGQTGCFCCHGGRSPGRVYSWELEEPGSLQMHGN